MKTQEGSSSSLRPGCTDCRLARRGLRPSKSGSSWWRRNQGTSFPTIFDSSARNSRPRPLSLERLLVTVRRRVPIARRRDPVVAVTASASATTATATLAGHLGLDRGEQRTLLVVEARLRRIRQRAAGAV